ncbi:hypothetical protein ACFY7C_24685 [Streptomyces sp. NPDC012769]|uniref:hypothetical protein n=1 Tax=Streptomyces sp. NPDC012769 TaxID=3364848 RepID=UPI0036C4C731
MKNDRRLRRLVVDGTTWHWTVRQRIRPRYEDCRLTLTFFPDFPAAGRNVEVDGWPYAEALMDVTDYAARRASA